MKINIEKELQRYRHKGRIFKNKEALTERFTPENIPHREEEITKILHALAPAVREEKPKNVFISGRPGTGKTLVIKKIMDDINKVAIKNKAELLTLYLNCNIKKVSDTEYRAMLNLIEKLGGHMHTRGLAMNELYNKFFDLIKDKRIVILIFDEVDVIAKSRGAYGMFYTFTRGQAEMKNTEISIVGITNKHNLIDALEGNIKHSVCQEEIIFPPYNADQLRDILEDRSKIAFYQNVVDDSVLKLCSAVGSKEHGDARNSLQLLCNAGEVAETKGSRKVTIEDVQRAREKLEMDAVLESIKTQPTHVKAVILAVVTLTERGNKNIQTGDIYNEYEKTIKEHMHTPLTQQRISDYLSELDTAGIINATIISHGRHGRTRFIRLPWADALREKAKSLLYQYFYRPTEGG